MLRWMGASSSPPSSPVQVVKFTLHLAPPSFVGLAVCRASVGPSSYGTADQ